MWGLVNPDDGAIFDIADSEYVSIYIENFPNIIWVEWSAAADDFNKENITEWCYDSSKTPPFIKKVSLAPADDINNSLEMNVTTAKLLLAKTDWAVLPDVNILNKQGFIDYRSTIRQCIIKPRAGILVWPDLIEAVWPKG